MTNEGQNELTRAIQLAKRTHDQETSPADGTAVILGSLIRAVELLAGQGQALGAAKVEPMSPGHFDDALVERMALVASDCDDTTSRGIVRAILAELTSMPCELPSNVELAAWFDECDGHGSIQAADNVRQKLTARITPHFVAKDAEIRRQQQVIRLQNKTTEGYVSRGAHEAQVSELEAQIADLGSRTPANEVQNAEREQYVITIGQQLDRITTLEKGLEASKRVNVEFCQERDAARAQVGKLEKRLAELTAPVDANGKTPGQIDSEAYALERYGRAESEWHQLDRDMQRYHEAGASAVLRAFGNGAMEALKAIAAEAGYPIDIVDETKLPAQLLKDARTIAGLLRNFNLQKARLAAEALRTVRKAIYNIPLNDESRNRYPIQIVDDAAKIIDAELAKLEPTSEHSPKNLVAKLSAVLRFCLRAMTLEANE